jgi:hypothetical protein
MKLSVEGHTHEQPKPVLHFCSCGAGAGAGGFALHLCPRVAMDIGEDGSVQTVKALSGDEADKEAAKQVAKQWKFKPYVKNGKNVAVQMVIQLDGKTEKMVQKP